MAAVKTRTVPSLDKGLCLLELLVNSRGGLTLAELVRQSGIPRSSIHYLLVTFDRRGYVNRNERTSRYSFSQKLVGLANAALQSVHFHQHLASHLIASSALHRRTSLTVHMAILDQTQAVLIAKQEATSGVPLATWIGKRVDLHCTSLGKALIAFLAKGETDDIMCAHRWPRHNENTLTNPRRLCENLERIVRLGYAFDNEEDEIGFRCIGAPILAPGGRPVAAISVAGTVAQISADNTPWLIHEVKQAASTISNKIFSIRNIAPLPSNFHDEDNALCRYSKSLEIIGQQ